MEIKTILTKPYTEKEKINFIVKQNHQNNYIIKETENELQAWGYTQDEIEEQKKEQRNQEIDKKIKELNTIALSEMRKGNTINVDCINQTISYLEKNKITSKN